MRRPERGGAPLRARILGLALLALAAVAVFASSAARARVVESVAVEAQEKGYAVRIRFNLPLRYVTHAPAARGKTLQVELRPADPSAAAQAGGRESPRLPHPPGSPLVSLVYDGDAPGGPNLVLRFARETAFRLRATSDPRSLELFLPRAASGEAAAKAAAVPKAAAAAKAPVPKTPVPKTPVPKVAAAPPPPSKPAAPPLAGAGIDPAYPYAINLLSSVEPFDAGRFRLPAGLSALRLYTTTFKKDGRVWHRLRLGFFASEAAARKALGRLRRDYPRAWVTRVSRAERIASAETAVREPSAAPAASASAAPAAPSAPAPSPDEAAKLMARAEAAMTAGELRRAVQLLTKILRDPAGPLAPKAQELLGLARERNGQLAHAKAEYEKYLRLYPEGEGAARVRQRLAALLTARGEPGRKLRKARAEEDAWRGEFSGSFSQFYTRDVTFADASTTSGASATVNRSDISSDLDLALRARRPEFELGAQFVGGHVLEFRDGSDDESRVNTLFVEAIDRRRDVDFRLGRQSHSTDGVLGRFDGAVLGAQIASRVHVNGIAGFPVASTTSKTVDTDRYFYGVGFDFGTFADAWDFNLFAINQIADGVTDRRAVGGEARYFADNRSFFSLLDYDVSYNSLNIALFSGNWTFPDRTTLSLVLDYRNSPILTTTNAIQGQNADDIAQLLNSFSESEIRALAEDRTATSRSMTISASRPINGKLQVSGDFTLSNLTGTPASGGVEAGSGTGNEYFYSVQLIGSSLLKEGDIAILGLRFADTATAKTTTFTLNTRYPVNHDWRINPRFRLDYRLNDDGGGERVTVRPSIRTDYRWRRHMRLEAELGGEWSSDHTADQQTDRSFGYFLRLGYRYDF